MQYWNWKHVEDIMNPSSVVSWESDYSKRRDHRLHTILQKLFKIQANEMQRVVHDSEIRFKRNLSNLVVWLPKFSN